MEGAQGEFAYDRELGIWSPTAAVARSTPRGSTFALSSVTSNLC